MSVKLWRNKPTDTRHIQFRRVFIEVLCFYARPSNNNLWLYILVIVATERGGINLSIIDRQIRIHQSLNFKVTHFPLPHTRCQDSITSGCVQYYAGRGGEQRMRRRRKGRKMLLVSIHLHSTIKMGGRGQY